MATLAEIRQFIAANDMLAEIQTDDKNIESGNMTEVMQGYSDLAALSNHSEYSSFFSEADGTAATFVKKDEQDAESYLQGVTVGAADENSSGGQVTDTLYDESYVWDSYYQEYVLTTPPNGSVAVTAWALLSGQITTLCTDVFQGPDSGWQPPSNSFWGSGNISKLPFAGEEEAAQGSAAAWAPFEVLSGGNDTALTQDMAC